MKGSGHRSIVSFAPFHKARFSLENQLPVGEEQEWCHIFDTIFSSFQEVKLGTVTNLPVLVPNELGRGDFMASISWREH